MKRKLTAMVLAVIMLVSLVGCATKDEGEKNEKNTPAVSTDSDSKKDKDDVVETKDPVTLEWWYRGNGTQKDTELVEDKANELLKTYKGLEHVSINLNCYTGGEYKNAVVLGQSAGKQMDILSTVSINFPEEVAKGTYLAMDEYLDQYSTLKETLPDWLWELGSINGKTYIVPSYQRASNMVYFITPTDYISKYGDADKMRSIFQNPNSTVAEIAAVLEEYGIAVQNGEGKTKYMPSLASMYHTTYGFTNFYDTINGDFISFKGENKVQNRYLTDEVKEAYAISADWYEKGYIHPDILTININDFQGANMLNDVSFIYSINNQAGDEGRVSDIYTTMYGFDTTAIAINTNYYISNTWPAGGNGVTASSKHPEEAMRFLEVLNTEEGKDLYNLFVYGIEGTHYEKLDDTHIKTLEYDGSQGGVDTSYAAMKWIMGNTFNAYLNQACTDDENEIAMSINTSEDSVKSDLIGFTADVEKIMTELEQTSVVTTEYSKPLLYGVFGKDWEKNFDDFVNKMNIANMDDVVTELQGQVDSFLGK